MKEKRKVDRLGQTVIDNEIVPANWFKRQWECVWDFLYFHVFPMRTIGWLGDRKRDIRRGFQRMFRGYDETISWGYESTIAFYKALLGDLIKYAHGHPGSVAAFGEICPREWQQVKDKWSKKVPEGKTFDEILEDDDTTLTPKEQEEYFEDCFNCWISYLKRVKHYFDEADSNTCSKRKEQEELYSRMKNPFDKRERKVVEINGVFVTQYPSLGDSPEDNEQRKILDELTKIDNYMTDQLKLGMAEVAKNILYLND